MRASFYLTGLLVSGLAIAGLAAAEFAWRVDAVDALERDAVRRTAAAERVVQAAETIRVERWAAAYESRSVWEGTARIDAVRLSVHSVLGKLQERRVAKSVVADLEAAEATLGALSRNPRGSLAALAAAGAHLESAGAVLTEQADSAAATARKARLGLMEWGFGACACAVLGLFGIWWLVRKGLFAPVRDLRAALDAGDELRLDPVTAALGARESRSLVDAVSRSTSKVVGEFEELSDAEAELAFELQKTNRAKSDFLASMSHEIRTPMTAILGYADLLERDEIDADERAGCLDVIRRNGQDLLTVINDILDISKIEAGKMTLESVACGPTVMVSEVATAIRHRAESKSVALEINYRDAVPASIETDPTRLRQVLTNTIGAGIEIAARDSRVDVDVSLAGEGEDAQLIFAVTPSRIELDRDDVVQMLDPFSVREASTRAPAGAGRLGLAIARRLTELLDGSFEIEFAEEDASESLTLRCAVPAGAIDGVEMAGGPPDFVDVLNLDFEIDDDVDLGGAAVLLVEDGPDNQELISLHLEDSGATVTICETAEDALDRIASGARFDVILMDMFLPGIDGIEAVRRLRTEGNNTSIVMLTASNNAEERDACLASGANEFVTKPVDRSTLVEAVQRNLPHGDAFADDSTEELPAVRAFSL